MNANETKSPRGVTVEELIESELIDVAQYYNKEYSVIAHDLVVLLRRYHDAANKRIAELEIVLNDAKNEMNNSEVSATHAWMLVAIDEILQPSPQPEADETPEPQVGETWHTANDGDVIIRKVREHFVDVSHVKKPDEIAGAVSIRHLTAKAEDKPVDLKPGMVFRESDDKEESVLLHEVEHGWLFRRTTGSIVQYKSYFFGTEFFVDGEWVLYSTGKPVHP